MEEKGIEERTAYPSSSGCNAAWGTWGADSACEWVGLTLWSNASRSSSAIHMNSEKSGSSLELMVPLLASPLD